MNSTTMAAPLTSAKTEAVNATASSPLLKLPPELRLQIYNFALQDTIESLDLSCSDKRTYYMLRPKYYGSLALLHASRLLQSEYACEMLPVVRADLAKREAHVDYLTGQLGHPMSRADREELWDEMYRANPMRCLIARLKKMLGSWKTVLSKSEDAVTG